MEGVSQILFRRILRLGGTVALALCIAAAALPAAESVSPDTLPMFGQPKIARTDEQKKSDEAFILDTTLRYGNRQTASNSIATQGWTAARSNQLDLAMQRFNQAWLLNPKNYTVFWGFGAVLTDRGKLNDALDQLEKARELVEDPTQRVALLCDLGAVHSAYAASLPKEKELERAQHFVLANSRFTESLENDPKFAPSWREWAISLFDQERYSEAWIRVQKARELKAEPFPQDFLKKLAAKMPEPK